MDFNVIIANSNDTRQITANKSSSDGDGNVFLYVSLIWKPKVLSGRNQMIGYIGAIFELGAILARHFLLLHIFGLWFETNREHEM